VIAYIIVYINILCGNCQEVFIINFKKFSENLQYNYYCDIIKIKKPDKEL